MKKISIIYLYIVFNILSFSESSDLKVKIHVINPVQVNVSTDTFSYKERKKKNGLSIFFGSLPIFIEGESENRISIKIPKNLKIKNKEGDFVKIISDFKGDFGEEVINNKYIIWAINTQKKTEKLKLETKLDFKKNIGLYEGNTQIAIDYD